MTEHPERSAFEPRLPEDPAYWSGLAARIVDSAEPVFAELGARRAWWNPLDRFAPVLAAGALAAAAAVTFVVLPAGSPDTAPPAGTEIVAATGPANLVENAFTPAPAPDVTALMVLANEESR